MLLLAHIGITLGTVLAWDKGLSGRAPSVHKGDEGRSSNPGRLAALGNSIDYRLVLLGAVLPDIIDKPLGVYLFREYFSNGRIFAHTLIFFLVLLAIGIYRHRRYARTGILTLSLCSGFHLILDRMWDTPHTLFWPAYGISFDKVDVSNWLSDMGEKLVSSPDAYIPEIIGFLVLIPFATKLLRAGYASDFIKTGSI